MLGSGGYDYQFVNLRIKQIYCMINVGDIRNANFRTFELAAYIKKQIKINKQKIKSDNEFNSSFIYLLIQVRSIIKYILSYTEKSVISNPKIRFHILNNEFYLILLRAGVIDRSISDYPLLKHNVSVNGFSETLIWYDTIHTIKGFKKKLSLWFKIFFRKFFWHLDNFFWGHSYSVPKIIRFSTLVISLYAILIKFGILKVITKDNTQITNLKDSIYFSIVTFSSLGYGDMRPSSDGFSNISIAFEAIIGIMSISLIIYVISKRKN